MIACKDGRIVYVGTAEHANSLTAVEEIDCEDRWITPGLIDCHTHLVYGGDRAHEWEQRLEGASYEAIARAGGGILSTMRATRKASHDALFDGAKSRLDIMLKQGVTTVEIKSGYGLRTEDEIKMLAVGRELGRRCPVKVQTTFLGAHALPPEFSGHSGDYVKHVCSTMLPQVMKQSLADAVDVFCEGIGFSIEETAQIFGAAAAHNLPVKIHAEQFSDLGGAALAASHGALSADHLEYLSTDGIAAMARAGTVAVLLPGAFYFTHETRCPPVAELRERGVPIAIASDCNPGTSPLTSPLLCMNMAATLFRLSVTECLLGMTRQGARALGLLETTGTLEAGKYCDLAIWDVETLAELVYNIGQNPLHQRVWRGQ